VTDPTIKLVVLDRDGVINQDSREFVKTVDEWHPLPGSIDAIAALSKAGFAVAVATNQSGLARGLVDEAALSAMHQKLRDLVAAAGGCVNQIVYCPHGPDDGCDCRKPRPGLLQQIGAHFEHDRAGVPVIGDSLRDLEAAQAIGARPILVRTGNGIGASENLPPSLCEVEVYCDLAMAAAVLIEE
jgi:D-glycero-D-manno-heptose 1,7-bisphosphate phosphatase